MSLETAPPSKSADSPSSRKIAESAGNLASVLAAAGNGIRITGLVLSVEDPREAKGTSAKGKPYHFASREYQIFAGNKAVTCKHQANPLPGVAIADLFPAVEVGAVVTFKIRSVSMNGTSPVFTLDDQG